MQANIAYQIDSQGFYLAGAEIIGYTGEATSRIVLVSVPDGLYKPRWNGGGWVEGASDAEIKQASGLPKTLDEAKIYMQKKLSELAATKQEALIAGYSAAERDTWDKKEQEANTLLADPTANVKYLKAEAQAMVGSTDNAIIEAASLQLAQVVVRKADQLRLASAAIAGTRARKSKEIDSLTLLDSVLNYPLNEGWLF